MSIGNRHVSHYKYLKPPPLRKKSNEVVRMPNATAEEIFQTQKINIKTLENKAVELGKQIKELKLENKNLLKANTLQERELKKTNEGSTGISSLMRSYKEEIRTIQSKVSSLQDQLRISENNLKLQEKAVSRKNQQIEKLTTAKRQNERQIKDVTLENKELKCEKEKVVKELEEYVELNGEFKLKNENLLLKIEQMTCKISELEDRLESAENGKAQLEEDLNQIQKSYDELKQNFSEKKPCTLVMAETQTDDTSNISNLYLSLDVGSKSCTEKCEVTNNTLKAKGDYWVDCENIKIKGIHGENSTFSSEDICKTKNSGLGAYQNKLIPHLPAPKSQKSLLKPIKSRTSFPLKTQSNEADFLPRDSSYGSKLFASYSTLPVSSNFLQSSYSTKSAMTLKYFS